ncbi:putative Ulp1 protease family catalytic domain, papain-like cysteine peptidase superfamily [Helianthus annuus]|nr:putative Ulp1 protease family catalytic domain, papain-like cysteine peptidase superfamily [Helianthus annuus]
MAKFYKKEKIPRFLSWGPGKRITSSTVERIFESSKTNEHYRPIQSLMATSNEMQTEWYISSMQYLESIRLAKQIPSNTSGFQKQNDGGADGFECFGSSFHMGTQQPKKRTSGNHAGVNYSIDDELQSLVEKFKSLLDENNEKLIRLIMSELRNQNGDQGSVHAFEKAEVDSFVNYNDVGVSHVPMEKLQPCDSLVDEAEIADLRRLERLLKPAAYMLSPFVVLNKVSRRQKRREESTERNVKMIRDWYTNELSLVSKKDSRLRRLGKTIGGEVGPEFWRLLLGDDGSGWLSDDHLYGWMIKMYESRQRTDRWTILPPYFQMTVFDCESTRKLKCYFDGSMYPVPRITEVDEVYVPLHIRNLHWFLGVFNLRDETLTIYDSRLESGTLEKGRTEVICHINFAFDIWLRINGYYADKPLKMSFPFKVVYPDKVPQQSGLLGDCGVWVCIFLERLINKQHIYQEEDTATVAYQMRQRLAILFYDSLLPENFDIVSTCKSMENDSDVQVV